LVVGVLALWGWSPRDLPETGTVRVTFVDVAQGDAALVETSEGYTMLIDGGTASGGYDVGRMAVAPLLWDRGIRRLDVVVATHPQQDHVGGLAFVVEKFEVGEFWTNGVSREAVFLKRLDAALASRGVPVRAVSSVEADRLLGDCLARVVNPAPSHEGAARGHSGTQLNNQSVVVNLRCGASAFLFTGDIERDAAERLAERGDKLEATVLKVPHHGAKGSVSPPFLAAVNPQVAVVSVGRANTYGHPSPVMLDTYAGLGIPVLRTDRHGAITIIGTEGGVQMSCESGRRLQPVNLETWISRSEALNIRRLFGEPGACQAAA